MVGVVAILNIHILEAEINEWPIEGPVSAHLVAASRGELSVVGVRVKAGPELRAVLHQEVAAHGLRVEALRGVEAGVLGRPGVAEHTAAVSHRHGGGHVTLTVRTFTPELFMVLLSTSIPVQSSDHLNIRITLADLSDFWSYEQTICPTLSPTLSPETHLWCPVIALRAVTNADGHVVPAVLVVTVAPGVAPAPRVLLVLVLEVPALPHLVPVLAHQLIAVVLVVQADVNLPGLVTRVGMLLSKPAPHGVCLRGGGEGRAVGGASVVIIAQVGVTGADGLVIVTVGLIIIVALVTEDGVLVADILLCKSPVLVGGVETVKPGVVVMSVIECQAEGLVPITWKVCEVGPRMEAVFPVPSYVCSYNSA